VIKILLPAQYVTESENVKYFKSLHGRDNLREPHIYWKMVLKLILEKYDVTIW
jgi:hypothetical protein